MLVFYFYKQYSHKNTKNAFCGVGIFACVCNPCCLPFSILIIMVTIFYREDCIVSYNKIIKKMKRRSPVKTPGIFFVKKCY